MRVHHCAIGLGSNLGDSRSILEAALAQLDLTPGISLKQRSRWYVTQAVGPPQPNYFNGCALLEVSLTPQSLLQQLLEIEAKAGRVRRERWGPRTLDLDLLLFDDLILETPTLNIPHPGLHQRAFVLVPLAEIAPNWVDPVSRRQVIDLLNQVDRSGVESVS